MVVSKILTGFRPAAAEYEFCRSKTLHSALRNHVGHVPFEFKENL
jgi:hypothetical protein